jgi:hypothetical protein
MVNAFCYVLFDTSSNLQCTLVEFAQIVYCIYVSLCSSLSLSFLSTIHTFLISRYESRFCFVDRLLQLSVRPCLFSCLLYSSCILLITLRVVVLLPVLHTPAV